MPALCRVLVVEGSDRVSRFVRPMFGGRLIEIASPVDYPNALEAISRLRPELVLLDLDGNPPQALAAVVSLMAQCPTPVLLMTGCRKDAIPVLAAGALDVVEKPARATPEFFKLLSAQMLLLAT